MNRCSSYLQEINIFSIVVRLGMSLLVGGILGTEQGLRNRPAGFMTYVLVCIGSTMVMLTNQYIAVTNPGTDPTRLAAQVVSGIGFLGAGMFFSVFALIVLKKVDVYIKQHAKSMEVYLEHNSQFSLRKLSDFACENHFVLYDMQRGKVKTLEEEFGTLIFTVGTSQKFNHSDVLEKIYTLEGIEYVREIS